MLSVNLKTAVGLIIGTLMPLIVHASSTERARPGDNYLGLDLTLAGSSFNSPALKTMLFGPAVDLIYRREFSLYAEARIDVAAEVLTGSATGVMPNDLMGQSGPRQVLRIRDAAVDLHTEHRTLSTRLGANNQRELGNPLLGGDMVFLGAVTELKGDTVAGETSLKFEGAVPPTSFSLLETAAPGKTPTFVSAQLGDLIGDVEANFVGASVGYFQFDNLTTAQARQSLFWGNSVTGTTNTAEFFLRFRGIEGGVRGGVRLTNRWQALATTNFIQNTAAPAGSGLGYLGTLGAVYRLDDAKIGASVGYLYDQSDSSPAVFADGFLNSKNHRGVVVDLKYDAATYSLFARALKTQALVPQLYGGDDVAVFLGVRVHYDFLK
jgi:hypothetical protein